MTKHEDDKVWLHQAKNTLQMKTHYTSPKQNGIHYAPPKQNGIHNQPMETSIAFFKVTIYFWFQKKKILIFETKQIRVIKEGFFCLSLFEISNIRFNNNPSNVFHPNSFKTLPGNMQSSSTLLVLMIKPSPFFTVLAYTISLQASFGTRITYLLFISFWQVQAWLFMIQ